MNLPSNTSTMKLSIPVLLVVLSIFFACKKEKKPAAKSTAKLFQIWYTGSPCAGSSVNFSSYDSFSRIYLWDYGDGKTSTAKAPNHTYTDTGVFTVKLTIDGDTSISKSKSIHIFPTPAYTHVLSGMITWRCARSTYQGGRDTTYPPSIQSFPITYIDPATIIINSDTLRFRSSTDDGTHYSSYYQWDESSQPRGRHKELTLTHNLAVDNIHYSESLIISIGSSDYVSYDAP